MKPRAMSNRGRLFVFGALVCVHAGCLQAQSQSQSQSGPESRWLTVGDAVLDVTRGGFDLGGGVAVSFGITREAFLNGTLAVSTSFQIADVSRLAPAQAQQIQTALSGMQLIQNGTNSVFMPGPAPSMIGTTIQNTLNNQSIRAQTVIDVGTDGARMLRGLNSTGTLRDAMVNSLAR
jgi:hypothetical protein